jgi:TonB family protein
MTALVLDHLWQSTLFAGMVGLLVLALRENGARLRYLLWFAASVKFLIPFAVLTIAGGWVAGLLPPVPASPLLAWQPMAQPFAAATVRLPAQALTPLLLAIWAIGSAAIITRWLLRWSRLRRILRHATPTALPAPVPVKMSLSLLEPGLVGILRPVILLPQGIDRRLSNEEMDAVLAHEICHLRRRDNLLAATHMLVEALFWFHPLIWWLGARLNAEREHACDEAVLAEGRSPQVYAESILKVCQFYLHSPLDCAAGISGADLKTRMERIMENRLSLRLSAARKSLLAGCAAIAIAAPLSLGLLAASPVLAPAMAQAPAAASSPTRAIPIPHTHTMAPYPALSRSLGEQGATEMLVTVGYDGVPISVELMKSSGFQRLDDAALEHVKAQWRWQPPTRNGSPVAVRAPVRIRWNPQDAP